MIHFDGLQIGANVLCAMAVATLACITDWRTRRIPNVLTIGASVAALLFHTLAPSGIGFFGSFSGWLVGAAIMFVPFALRGLGGGDVKLLATIGAWTGPGAAFWIGIYTGIVGGVLAIVVAARYRYLRRAFQNIWFLLQHWTVTGIRPLDEVSLEGSNGPRLVYAFPILAGLVITIWVH